jgi:hypothetical protein
MVNAWTRLAFLAERLEHEWMDGWMDGWVEKRFGLILGEWEL